MEEVKKRTVSRKNFDFDTLAKDCKREYKLDTPVNEIKNILAAVYWRDFSQFGDEQSMYSQSLRKQESEIQNSEKILEFYNSVQFVE